MSRPSVILVFLGLVGYSTSAMSDGTNPLHLDAYINNPFYVTGKINSSAPSHHTPYGGDLSLDVKPATGTAAGAFVYFKATPRLTGTSVRGRIVSGGSNGLVLACNKLSDGGYRLKIEIQQKKGTGSWVNTGWVTYAHLSGISITRANNTYVYNGSSIGYISSLYGGTCSTGPHIHMELWNKVHYSGYVSRSVGSTFAASSALACVGGGRLAEDSKC